MKKSLLTLLAALSCTVMANATEWSVVGEYNNWDQISGQVMDEGADGTYSITLNNFQGQFKFVKDGNWQGCIGSAVIENLTGNGTISVATPGKFNLNVVDEAEEITFVLNPETLKLTISGLPNDMDTSMDNQPQITEGAYWCVTVPEAGFHTYAHAFNKVGEGLYSIYNVPHLKDSYIAFSKADISFPPGYDVPADIRPLLKDYLLGCQDTPADGIVALGPQGLVNLTCPAAVSTVFQIMETGYYNMYIDYNNMTLQMEKIDLNEGQWSIIGDFSSWADDVDMTRDELGNWTVTMQDFTGEFKFRYNHTWDVSLGSYSNDVIDVLPDQFMTYPILCNGSNFVATQIYESITFTLNVDTMGLGCLNNQGSGVAEIAAETDNAIYYDLQGVRVANPTTGLYIRVTPTKAEKVIL